MNTGKCQPPFPSYSPPFLPIPPHYQPFLTIQILIWLVGELVRSVAVSADA